ncbi:hypothetical protein [Emcibacter nanhaiensis]|uniref:IS1595 family transposase n=1 Tax=Emcibacter nanhaiensis TaxID=1505037 RepID=A0A501PP77_9PROT|nr:hypothetical protein [Emcibacter nanhaiensis]TPD61571.1 hypothetical protein FIV46_05005 [Emcibacter nanhaiensis]
MKNKYCIRSRISEDKFRQLLKSYIGDRTAQQTADETNMNINSIDRYFRLFRERVVLLTGTNVSQNDLLQDSYPQKADHILIGVLEKREQACAEIITADLHEPLAELLSQKPGIKDVVRHRHWPGYDELIDVSHDRRIRLRATGIAGFWDFAHLRLAKFRGMHKSTFLLHLKECEWRYNNRDQDLYATLLAEFRNYPLGRRRPLRPAP